MFGRKCVLPIDIDEIAQNSAEEWIDAATNNDQVVDELIDIRLRIAKQV